MSTKKTHDKSIQVNLQITDSKNSFRVSPCSVVIVLTSLHMKFNQKIILFIENCREFTRCT